MKRKLNYKNIMLFLILLITGGMLIHDFIIICFSLTQLTYFGVITNILSLMVVVTILDYFDDYITEKNVSNTGTVKHKNK